MFKKKRILVVLRMTFVEPHADFDPYSTFCHSELCGRSAALRLLGLIPVLLELV